MDLKQVRNGVFAVVLGSVMNVAEALPISGVLEFAGVFTPVQQGSESISGFSKVKVSYMEGDFTSWLTIGQSANMGGVDLSVYPTSWSVGGVDIDLLSGLLTDQNDQPLDLSGLGLVNFQNYDQTNITWSFSETILTSKKSLFSFRLETVDDVNVPEPSAVALLLIGMLSCGFLRRRVK